MIDERKLIEFTRSSGSNFLLTCRHVKRISELFICGRQDEFHFIRIRLAASVSAGSSGFCVCLIFISAMQPVDENSASWYYVMLLVGTFALLALGSCSAS